MKHLKTITTLTGAAALMLTVGLVPASAQLQAPEATTKVVKTAYSDDLFQVTYTASGATAKHLDFAAWRALGFATPIVVNWVDGARVVKQAGSDNLYTLTDGIQHLLTFKQWADGGYKAPTTQAEAYVKYPWSTDLYAVSFFGTARSEWVWRKLNFNEWLKLGQPKATNAGWIAGSNFYKMPGSNDVYVGLGNSEHKLTFAEWAAAGYPAPATLTCGNPHFTYAAPTVTTAPAGQSNVATANVSWAASYTKTSEVKSVTKALVYGQIVGRDASYIDENGFGNTVYYLKPVSCIEGTANTAVKGGSGLIKIKTPINVTPTQVQHISGWQPPKLGSNYALFLDYRGGLDLYTLSSPWAQFEYGDGKFYGAAANPMTDDLGVLAKLAL